MTRPCKCRSNTVIRFSVSNTLNQNTVFAIFAKHTKSKHCVWTITRYNQWLNFYRRRALGNSPRPTLSIYCPEVRKYLLVWFAILPSSKWEHSSCCRRQFRSNIVIQSAVSTLCFVTSGQTVLLQTRCLDYYSIKSIPKPYRRCAFGNSPRPTL